MARRWRIRHKLMLGLATAIGILALLVGGTLNGMWSYYVTMKSIKYKLDELEKADVLKLRVSVLTLPDHTDDGLATLDDFKKRVPPAEDALTKFEEAFQDTLRRELTADDGAQLGGIIKALYERFSALQELCAEAEKKIKDGDGGEPDKAFTPWRTKIRDLAKDLERTSGDLRGGVREDLTERIARSIDVSSLRVRKQALKVMGLESYEAAR